jgi:CRISPR-associated protein Csh1
MLAEIKALADIIAGEKGLDKLEILVENPKVKSYLHAITIDIEHDEKGFTLSGVSLEQLSDEKKMDYLYRRGASGGADLSPTAKITEVNKTFNNKIIGWFRYLERNKRKITLKEEDWSFLNGLVNLLIKNKEKIIAEVENKQKLFPARENAIITIKVNQKYIGQYELFRRILLKLEGMKEAEISAADKTCSICGQKKEFVSGNVNVFTFYTNDKPGFIAGGFDKKLAWRNYPVCQDCKLALEMGREFIETNLKFTFVRGLEYLLIPKFLFGTSAVSRDIIDIFTDGPKKISLAGKTISRMTADENEILALLMEEKDALSVQFLFLRASRGAERILLLIEDVYPSTLRKIFDAKADTDKKWEIIERQFNFGTLRTFFAKSDENKRDNDLDKYYLQLIDNIFRLKPVDKNFVLQFIMKKIRHDFNNELDSYHWVVLDGLLTLTYLMSLGLFKISREEAKTLTKSKFEEFFTGLSPMFSNPVTRGIFLLGVLTELLLNVQYAKRESKPPFLKQLKGLRLTERDMRGLLPKVQNKLTEYEAFDKGKRQLAEEISTYLLQAGESWELSIDEINFYFAAGMNLANKLAEIIYEKEKEAE